MPQSHQLQVLAAFVSRTSKDPANKIHHSYRKDEQPRDITWFKVPLLLSMRTQEGSFLIHLDPLSKYAEVLLKMKSSRSSCKTTL